MKYFSFRQTDYDPKFLRREFREYMKSVLPGTVYWRVKPKMVEKYDFDTTFIKYGLVARGVIGPVSEVAYVNLLDFTENLGFNYPTT